MKDHCCQSMNLKVNFRCVEHSNPYDCPDHLIYYNERFDEYSLIIHDGGHSSIQIEYCPWCGTKLPESKSDLWFKTLEQLGFDEPFQQDIPEEFTTGKWYTK